VKLKIENSPVVPYFTPPGDGADLDAFAKAIKELKVGQSFVIPSFNQYRRNCVSFAERLLDREFVSRKLDNGHVRVGRTK